MKVRPLDLQTFAAVVEQGGISAAARVLGVPKSSVSRDLAALERRLGTRLVQRTTRRLSLTHAGEVLLAYARRIAEEIGNAEAAVESLRDAPRGHLAVTAPYALLRSVLVPRIAEFRAQYPELRISFDPTLRVLDLVQEGIDVALRFGDVPAPSAAASRLGDLPLIFVASPDYVRKNGQPRTVAELVRHELIDMGTKAALVQWRLVGPGAPAKAIDVEPRLAIADPSIVLDLVERGLGIAAAPEILARRAMAEGRLVRVLPELTRGTRCLSAVYPSRQMLAPKVQAFIAFVVDCIRSEPA